MRGRPLAHAASTGCGGGEHRTSIDEWEQINMPQLETLNVQLIAAVPVELGPCVGRFSAYSVLRGRFSHNQRARAHVLDV
eukprot:1058788-Amphidinium_carterae.1